MSFECCEKSRKKNISYPSIFGNLKPLMFLFWFHSDLKMVSILWENSVYFNCFTNTYLEGEIYFELSKSIISSIVWKSICNIFSAHLPLLCCVVHSTLGWMPCIVNCRTVGGPVVWNSPKADENVRWFPRSHPRTISHFRNAGRILTWIKLLKRDQKQLPPDVFVTKNRSHSSQVTLLETISNNCEMKILIAMQGHIW